MSAKKKLSTRCKNCNMLPNEHNSGQYDDLLCEVERLPIQVQEMYNKPSHTYDSLGTLIVYNPMGNLEMLEYEYERRERETPTRSSLQ